MTQPFSIERQVDGQTSTIKYNQSAAPDFQPNEMNTLQEQMINDLSELGETDVKILIEMNMMQQREVDQNKALILAQAQKISDKDLLKKLYPNEWRELYDNLIAQGGAMALVEKMSSYGQDFVQMMAGMIDEYAKQFNVKAEQKQ